MFRGFCKFRCSKCGKRFIAPDIEYCATALSMPQKCPRCGSLRTRPASFMLFGDGDACYKSIWDQIESETSDKNK